MPCVTLANGQRKQRLGKGIKWKFREPQIGLAQELPPVVSPPSSSGSTGETPIEVPDSAAPHIGSCRDLTWCFFRVNFFFIRSSSFLYHCLSPQNWCSCGTPPPEAEDHLGPHCSSTLPYHTLLRGTFFGKKCPENEIIIKCFCFRGTFCPFREIPRGTFWPESAPKMK